MTGQRLEDRCVEEIGGGKKLVVARGLVPVQTGDIVYISNRGHGLQVNTHGQEVSDHALEPRVPHESTNQTGR